MKYRLLYTSRAVKDVERLETQIRQRIGKTLLRYAEDPLKYATNLTESRLGTYRFRIGHYRVIFDLDDDKIVILRVGHRRDIYKR
ncbi:MAG: type II toxin-antitoxin system RelE/ParE family toxin [Thermodesulfobacteriota bacterium]|nr:type II toxin-antitoxin system RelE/ParE family toxin [Thermodesulfobacteriota bacterium]